MSKRTAFGVAIIAAFLSAPAWAAQSPRTFVSVLKGEDTGGCTVNPCLTFNYAITQTSAGGEVIAIDSASSYAPVNITKSVTIEAAPGAYAGITVSSGDGITVNAGTFDTVVLRGLTIKGSGGGNGVTFNTAAVLHVENCVISGMSNNGINFVGPGTGDFLRLFVKDSFIRDNGVNGIYISNSKGLASIDRVRLEDNQSDGLGVSNGKASIRGSVASGNDFGFVAQPSSGTAEIDIESCLVANNTFGVESDGTGATIRVSDSTVTDNIDGGLEQTASGVLLSRGNNTVEGSVLNESGTIGAYSAK